MARVGYRPSRNNRSKSPSSPMARLSGSPSSASASQQNSSAAKTITYSTPNQRDIQSPSIDSQANQKVTTANSSSVSRSSRLQQKETSPDSRMILKYSSDDTFSSPDTVSHADVAEQVGKSSYVWNVITISKVTLCLIRLESERYFESSRSGETWKRNSLKKF